MFITGASGFIGSNLAKGLSLGGYDVVVFLRENSSHPLLEGLGIKKTIGDLNNKASIRKGLAGCRYVFHCAAKVSFNRYDYENLYRANVEGTRNILEMARAAAVEKFFHISACAVLGYTNDKARIIDEGSTYKVPKNSVYAYTKKLAEDEVVAFCQKGLRANIALPCTVYGAGDKALNSGLLIKSIYKGRLKMAPPGGTSVISVDDLVEGLNLLIEKGRDGERYIFSAENFEYLDLFNKIANVLGAKEIRYKLPNFFRYPCVITATIPEVISVFINKKSSLLTSQIIKETFGYKYYSSKKAKLELGWQPKVDISSSIKEAFEFYKKEHLI